MKPFTPARELDVLNSACCRVKGVELVAGDLLDGNFGSCAGALVTLPSGETVPIEHVAETLRPLMQALLVPMRNALRGLREDAAARGVSSPPSDF